MATPADTTPSQQTPFQVDDPARLGRPSRIVPPEFPKKAIEQRLSGFVDVEGRVTPLRQMEDVEFRTDSPESLLFRHAVEEVLGLWEFHPPTENDCFPSGRRVVNRVSFEWKDGEPKIFVTFTPDPKLPPHGRQIRALERVEPQYPRAAIVQGLQAIAYVQLHIAPDGSVPKVEARAYPERKANAYFVKEIETKMAKWRFPPAGVDDPQIRLACYDVLFRFKP